VPCCYSGRVKSRPPSSVAVPVAGGVLLDSRRALVHVEQGWMALADLHYGYELRRRRAGALLPDWGMPQCEETLVALLNEHRPRRLILVGDVMDGSGSLKETLGLLERLGRLTELVCIEGNHDSAGLRKAASMVTGWLEPGFVFEHGHRPLSTNPPPGVTITGHEHPALRIGDGAGLRLKLPALVMEGRTDGSRRWILPAFSPWAAGGEYKPEAAGAVLTTWACAPGRVWKAF
jgi:metallophosphoesterase superfamily enzyme